MPMNTAAKSSHGACKINGPVRRLGSVSDLIERYAEEQLSKCTTAKRIQRQLSELFADHFELPLADLDELAWDELRDRLEALRNKRPGWAEQSLYSARAFFVWAGREGRVGRDYSWRLPDGRHAWGSPPARERLLDFAEIAEIWRASEELSFPCGPLVRFLLATAATATDVAWIRPSDVFHRAGPGELWDHHKQNRMTGEPHLMPLNFLAGESFDEALEASRRKGKLVFSATDKPPLSALRHAKVRLVSTIDSRRRAQGLDPMPHWNFPDIRETFLERCAPDYLAAAYLNKAGPQSHAKYLHGCGLDNLLLDFGRLADDWGAHIENALGDAENSA